MRLRTIAWAVGLCLSLSRYAGAESKCAREQSPAEIDARIDRLIRSMTIPERIAQLQDRAPAIPRLGLPGYNWWNEGLHGAARDGYATVFPQAIGLAATWDPVLLHSVGDVVSTEARARFNTYGREDTPRYGGVTIWSPNINIFRDPRWGRGQETYGEDPFLTATLGTQFVHGLQGDDPFYRKADATPKHFAVHSGPETGRDSFNAVVSAHDLADTYFPAFHAVTADAGAAAMMCSYNEINGVPSCANEANLQRMVRERWGFRGYVVSDCDAVGDIDAYHHYAVDSAHGAALALNAGVDLDCGNTYDALRESLRRGLTTEAQVNRALHRLLAARVHLGMMDRAGCTPYDSLGAPDVVNDVHGAFARRAAAESIVLLKNSGVLPLPHASRVAVVGPNADTLKVLEANYHGTALHPVTLLDGVARQFADVRYAQGSLLAEGMAAPVPRTALRTAMGAEAVPGLRAEFFDQPSLDGKAVVTTTVPRVELDLDRVGPDPAIHAAHYAARWSGSLVPPAAGEYELRVHVERCWDCTTHDRYRLYLDGQVVVDNDGSKGAEDHVTVHAADTRPRALRLELWHTGEDEGITLEWVPPASALLQEAVQRAKDADVIVACVGLSPDLEGEALQVKLAGFAGGDRTSLDLPASQLTMLHALRALGKPMVVVVTSGSAVAPGEDGLAADALLEAWYPGQSGGEALAGVLDGSINPSGRLPVTFYRSVRDLPAFTDYSMAHRTYRYFDGPVLYPFGFGLSYSRFVYSNVRLSTASLTAGQRVTVTAEVRNESERAGDAVAELYTQPPQVGGAPRLMLGGMLRVTLRGHEMRRVTFTLGNEQLGTVDAEGKRAVRPGVYRIFIGGTQPDPAQEHGTALTVEGVHALPY